MHSDRAIGGGRSCIPGFDRWPSPKPVSHFRMARNWLRRAPRSRKRFDGALHDAREGCRVLARRTVSFFLVGWNATSPFVGGGAIDAESACRRQSLRP